MLSNAEIIYRPPQALAPLSIVVRGAAGGLRGRQSVDSEAT